MIMMATTTTIIINTIMNTKIITVTTCDTEKNHNTDLQGKNSSNNSNDTVMVLKIAIQ